MRVARDKGARFSTQEVQIDTLVGLYDMLDIETGIAAFGVRRGRRLPRGTAAREFFFRDGTLCVVDLRSSCGTYVNGRRIVEPTVLCEGDKVYVGDFVLVPSVL